MKNIKNSKNVFKQALKYMPGGVNSPVRSFSAVKEDPRFIKRSFGAYIEDIDNNIYIDYISSFGPLIFGHGKKEIIDAAKNALDFGTTYGACHMKEVKLAKIISKLMPSMEMLRLTSSGTEATMSAIRAARGFTGKDKIIKFEGCYHGHIDHLLVSAGSGASTFGEAFSKGVPNDFIKNTLIADFNNLNQVKKIIYDNKDEIAAIIMEPIPANMGLVLPNDNFVQEIRKICDENRIVLIFDEVITGFRASLGGAEQYLKVKPDMSCIGKIIGGGFPIGAFGGKKEIMENISPLGGVYHAGTLSGNPVAVSAGLATLNLLLHENKFIYKDIELKALKLKENILSEVKNVSINQLGSMLTIFFTDNSPKNFDDVKKCNFKDFGIFFRSILNQGIMFPPSQFETIFVSSAHTEKDINKTSEVCIEALKTLEIPN